MTEAQYDPDRTLADDIQLSRVKTQHVPREYAEAVADAFGPHLDVMADLADPESVERRKREPVRRPARPKRKLNTVQEDALLLALHGDGKVGYGLRPVDKVTPVTAKALEDRGLGEATWGNFVLSEAGIERAKRIEQEREAGDDEARS